LWLAARARSSSAASGSNASKWYQAEDHFASGVARPLSGNSSRTSGRSLLSMTLLLYMRRISSSSISNENAPAGNLLTITHILSVKALFWVYIVALTLLMRSASAPSRTEIRSLYWKRHCRQTGSSVTIVCESGRCARAVVEPFPRNHPLPIVTTASGGDAFHVPYSLRSPQESELNRSYHSVFCRFRYSSSVTSLLPALMLADRRQVRKWNEPSNFSRAPG